MTRQVTPVSGANGSGLPLSEDLMSGAPAIAAFMFGQDTETNRRRVYHAKDKLGMPCFNLGGTICARKSTILKWIEEKERAA